MLSESRLRQRALFDPHFVRRLIEENNSGRRDAAFTLFSLLCMEIWCQHFLDYQTLKK
jgi:asparagine synthase (glutamine-hydrolysing)